MSCKVVRLSEVKTEKILGGPIKPVVNPKTVGSKNMVFALGIFNPDEGLVSHKHPQSEEVYYIIHGNGTVYIGEEREEKNIEPEMALYIPPGAIHAVKNTGKEKLVIAFFVAPGSEPSEEIGE